MSFISKFQLSTLFSKQNLPAILTIALLISTVGILFWYGDKKIQEASDINSTVISWENLETSFLNAPFSKEAESLSSRKLSGVLESKNLNFTIHNVTSEKNAYEVEWLLNDRTIDSKKISLGKKREIIPPTEKVLAELATLYEGESKEVLYQAKISWDKNKTEILGKWVGRYVLK